ncbi:DUF535 family protein, partial [Salmonella enterica subsp. enterica serovar Anatum]|nr:DUF535 family protein [Salmonella enterica subsp. enterica serovar Anatum]
MGIQSPRPAGPMQTATTLDEVCEHHLATLLARQPHGPYYLLCSLVMPRATSQLLTNLTQWPELNTLLARQPRLPIRLHRPYMAV